MHRTRRLRLGFISIIVGAVSVIRSVGHTRYIMGYSLSWAAVKGGTPAAVLEALALRGTGATEEIPESEITGAALPGGWYLVMSQRDCLEFTKDKVLEELSSLGEVVTCFVEEHVVCSLAACWHGRQLIWSVYHNSGGRGGNLHLDIKGEPPPAFACAGDNSLGPGAQGSALPR
jgi:hypothetical protein